MRISSFIAIPLLFVVFSGCSEPPCTDSLPCEAVAPEAAPAETVTLFDGTHLDAWRGFKRDDVPAGWTVTEDSLLTFTPGVEGGDIISRDTFSSFDLTLEWRISEGGNSGIFFHVSEETNATYEAAPEMQVLDDERHPDGQSPLTSAGANYALHAAPDGAVKGPGQWNAVRITVRGDSVRYELNGIETAQYVLGSDDWQARVANSKFADWPWYGKGRSGHIALQDHGDPVAYRNIRITRL